MEQAEVHPEAGKGASLGHAYKPSTVDRHKS
jgi:hypothetical protein